MKKNLFKLSILFFLAAAGFYGFTAVNGPARAQTAGDAIALRVIPNPEHYSAARWYREKKFTGSPQSLLVDGYEAVRDGRTVYVNAANVNAAANQFFTNIYLISYNQQAEDSTVDIFGRILESWKFNTNLVTPGVCSLSASVSCLDDKECPSGEYCLSQKSRVTRDTRRLSDLTELGEALEQYRQANRHYPLLTSGTYLPYKSLSVWPSWKTVLGQVLKFNIPSDPVNKMGNCGGPDFHPVTCWNEDNKTFPTDLNAPVFPDPGRSRTYFYSTNDNGDTVRYCALLETNYPNLGSYNCLAATGPNHPPQFVGAGLPAGIVGQPYYGYIEAIDPDGDPLAWSISGGPILETSEAPNQRRVYVPSLGGSLNFSMTVNDGRGGTATQNFTIAVGSVSAPTVGTIGNYDIIIGDDISFNVSASDPGGRYPLRFDFSSVPSGFNGRGALDANRHDWHAAGEVVDYTRGYGAALTVYNADGNPAPPVGFRINVGNNPPAINTAALPAAIACLPYNFTVNAADPDGHDVSFSLTGPAVLSINGDTGEISGRIEAGAGDYPVRITVRDEYYDLTVSPYSAETFRDFNLHVSNEDYTVTMPDAYDFYVAPAGVNPENLYHSPFSYFGLAEKSTPNRVVWSLATNPSDLMEGLSVGMNSDNGEITAQSVNNDINSGGYHFSAQVTATTYGCNIARSGNVNLSVYPNEWCGHGALQALEQCELPGNGTSINNQWQCLNCSWSGGWCGNGHCEIQYETYNSCPNDCLGATSEYSVCTDVVSQPSCYAVSVPNPILYWQYNSTSNEYCDCNNTPPGDCPYGTPCLAETQTAFAIEIDDNSDYSSPEVTIGPILNPNHFFQVNSTGLAFDRWYYWRLRVLTSMGTASDWVQCTGPFQINPRCGLGVASDPTPPVVTSFSVTPGSARVSWRVEDS